MDATEEEEPPPSTLFLQEDGSPLRFYVPPGPWKQRLQPLIMAGGGVLCRLRESGALLLAPPGAKPVGPEPYFSARYVPDCVRAACLLETAAYRLPPAPCCAHQLPPRGAGRSAFTRAEDLAILLYLRDHAGSARATGNALWREMGRLQLTRHSWQSMRDRYLKQLRGQEVQYQLQDRTNIPTLVYPSCKGCLQGVPMGQSTGAPGGGHSTCHPREPWDLSTTPPEGQEVEVGGSKEESMGGGMDNTHDDSDVSTGEPEEGGSTMGPEEENTGEQREPWDLSTAPPGGQAGLEAEHGWWGRIRDPGEVEGSGPVRDDGSTGNLLVRGSLESNRQKQHADSSEGRGGPEQNGVAGPVEGDCPRTLENGAGLQCGGIKPLPGESQMQDSAQACQSESEDRDGSDVPMQEDSQGDSVIQASEGCHMAAHPHAGTVRSSRRNKKGGGIGVHRGRGSIYRNISRAFQEIYLERDSFRKAHEGAPCEYPCAVGAKCDGVGSPDVDNDSFVHRTKVLQGKVEEGDSLVEGKRESTVDLFEGKEGCPVAVRAPRKRQNADNRAKPRQDGTPVKGQNAESTANGTPQKKQDTETGSSAPWNGSPRKEQIAGSSSDVPQNDTPQKKNTGIRTNAPLDGTPWKGLEAENGSSAPRNGSPLKEHNARSKVIAPLDGNAETSARPLADGTPRKRQNADNGTNALQNIAIRKWLNAGTMANAPQDSILWKEPNAGTMANATQDGTPRIEQYSGTLASATQDGTPWREQNAGSGGDKALQDRDCLNSASSPDQMLESETPEDMTTRNSDRVKIKRKKEKEPVNVPEDLEDREDVCIKRQKKDSPMIRHENLKSSEDDEIQIKRRVKASPARRNYGIFEKASQEFESEDDTPELVGISSGNNRLSHRSPELPSYKQMPELKRCASHEDSRVAELKGSPKKNEQCTRSPERTACREAQGLKQFVFSEDSIAGDSQTPVEAVPSNPSASQTEVDNATKYFQSLMEELGLSLSTVTQAFLKNNGELEATQYFLKNRVRPDGYPIWTCQDDLDLKTGNDKLRRKLVNKFGTDNVAKRIAFLRS